MWAIAVENRYNALHARLRLLAVIRLKRKEYGVDPIQIMDDLFFVERGFLNGNHFVYKGEELILIDTAYVSDFHETQRLITGIGVDLSDVRLIVNTHTHCDHIGGNRIIQERSGCDIALHKIGKYFIDTRDDWSTWWKYFKQEADFFRCTRALEDREVISLGPHEFEVIYTPGHASDGIVLYNSRDKLLISSDTLWENDMAVMTVRVEGSRAVFAMMESLEKIEDLDVEIVYPGHGGPFTDFQEAVRKAKKRLNGFMEDRDRIGNDLLKKIIIYTLMVLRTASEDGFFDYLMDTHWFRETIDLSFHGEYQAKYDEIMKDFFDRGIVKADAGKLFTTVKP